MESTTKFQGRLTAAFVEIEPSDGSCVRVLFRLEGDGWVELTGVEFREGFRLPEPLGCECSVSDISERGLESAKFEISFRSSYSGDGTFFAQSAQAVQGI